MVETPRLQAKNVHHCHLATYDLSFVILRLDRRIQEVVLAVVLDPAIKSQDDIWWSQDDIWWSRDDKELT